MSTVFCEYCSAQLSYPAGAQLILCPKCQNVMNPQAPQETTCINCKTLLAHPPTSQFIQCPKCFTVMNVRNQHKQTPHSPNKHIPLQPNAAAADKGKQKKKRDPKAPKVASNAYMIFCKEMRPKLKRETDLSFGKIGAKLGEMWRNLPNEEKKPYEDKAAADRERYRKQMEAYQNGSFVETSGQGDGSDDAEDEDQHGNDEDSNQISMTSHKSGVEPMPRIQLSDAEFDTKRSPVKEESKNADHPPPLDSSSSPAKTGNV